MGDMNGARRAQTLLTVVAFAVLTGLAVLAPAAPAAAVDASERITDLKVAFALRADGTMHVTETIRYDFGKASERHGIERFIPVTFDYDSERNRVYPLTHASASSPSGAPSALEVTDGDLTTLRVGDTDTTVSGVQTYTLQYDLAGVVNSAEGGQELYWNALGADTAVPVARASVTVTGPGAAVQRADCFEGRRGSEKRCTWSVHGGTATYTATRSLAPHEGLTVVAGFPAETFPGAGPILEEKWKITKAFAVNPGTGAGALGAVTLFAGGTGLLVARRGRDRRYLDVTLGLTPGSGQQKRTGLVGRRRLPVAVQFTPPGQLRVGELGTLIDEQANVADVTATIIDLAVRGYLRIEEASPSTRDEDSDDWVLIKIGTSTDDLRDYERHLFDAIFTDGRERVRLSELRTTFRADLRLVQTMLYHEVTERGWFVANPRAVRVRWRGYAGAVLGVGALGTVVLAIWTHLALLGIAVIISGGVMMFLAGRMPARTASGTALLAQVRGFRLYLETAEADQIRFEEGQDVFSRYLPYAIVFGVAERWADVFARVAASGRSLPEPIWYGGSGYAWGTGSFDYRLFGSSMDHFCDQTSSSIATSVPSASGSSGSGGFSGGFSGGGGGGGGVGSW